MTDLFFTGGPLFMGLLTIILAAIITIAAVCMIQLRKKVSKPLPNTFVKELGIFGFITGITGQFLGLYNAFAMIERAGTISPDILAAGLKVSSIPAIYGLIICIIGYLLYFGLSAIAQKSA